MYLEIWSLRGRVFSMIMTSHTSTYFFLAKFQFVHVYTNISDKQFSGQYLKVLIFNLIAQKLFFRFKSGNSQFKFFYLQSFFFLPNFFCEGICIYKIIVDTLFESFEIQSKSIKLFQLNLVVFFFSFFMRNNKTIYLNKNEKVQRNDEKSSQKQII